MEYETKKWVVRWAAWPEKNGIVKRYDRQFQNQFEALRKYRKQVERGVLTATLIRIDVKNNEYIIDNLDKALPGIVIDWNCDPIQRQINS